MIKPTELRRYNFISPTTLRKGIKIPSDIIGKIVSLEHFYLEWIRVEEIPACVVRWNRCEYHEIEPISLTKEWLLRFGFIQKGSHYFVMPNDCHLLEIQEVKSNLGVTYHLVTKRKVEPRTAIGNAIRFLHQLQNLYFALTGEELTIKETV